MQFAGLPISAAADAPPPTPAVATATTSATPATGAPLGAATPAGSPAPAAVPAYGDLSHLEFSATGPLVATVIAPAAGSAATVAATSVEVATGLGAGVEIRINGAAVSFSKIGKRVIDRKAQTTTYTYYGVPLQPGPNDLVAAPLGASGYRGPSVSETIYGPGRPASLSASVSGAMRADGRSLDMLHVAATDQWHHPAMPGSVVRLIITGGDAHFQRIVRSRDTTSSASPAPLAEPLATPAQPAAAPPLRPLAAAQSPSSIVAAWAPSPPVRRYVLTGSTITESSAVTTSTPAAVTPSAVTPTVIRPTIPSANALPVTAAVDPSNGAAATFGHAPGDVASATLVLELPLQSGGTLEVPIVPGLRSGDVHVALTTSSVVAQTQFFLAPDVRAPLISGLVTAGAGAVPGVPGTSPGDPNESNSRRARIALFASGQVAKNTLGTVAYDTADVLRSSTLTGPFIDDPNDRPYTTYGDASTRRDDALSRDHLFARFENGRDSVMWGEFQAQTGSSSAPSGSVGGFNLLVSGAKLEVGNQNVKVTAFNAKNDVAYARQVYAPTGLSTIGQLLHPDIAVGSDIVTLVALDRRTGAVASQTVLTRNVDYTLDYATGLLRFINIPLPFDNAFNPQQLLVQYEYDGTGSATETLGGRIEAAFGKAQQTRAGIGYVNDATGMNNFTLLGEDVGGVLPGGSWSLAHFASRGVIGITPIGGTGSRSSPAPAAGDTYHAAFSEVAGPNRFAFGYDATSTGYNDPFGGLATPGLTNYNVAYARTLPGQRGELSLTYDYQKNDGFGFANAQSDLGVHLRESINKRLTFHAGIDSRASSAAGSGVGAFVSPANTLNPAPVPSAVATTTPAGGISNVSNYAVGAGNVTQAQFGFDWKLMPTVALAAERIADVGGAGIASQPAQTAAQLSVDFAKKGRAYVRQLWASAPTQSFAASTTALTAPALATRSTAIGVERAVGQATSLDDEYVVERTGSGTDVFSAMGVKERFTFEKRLKGEFFMQHASAIGANVSGYNIYGFSATYGDEGQRLRGTTSYQLRTGQNPGSTLLLGLAGALSPDVSVFASANYSAAYGTSNDDARFGLAWRPSQNERGVTLLSYEQKSGSLLPLPTRTDTMSLEQLYRPTRRLELAARYAYKLDGDAYYPARTSLFDLRAVQRLGSRFDIAGETRYLDVRHVSSAGGFALEAGLRLGDTMRLAGGYNFSAAADPSLAAAPTRRGLYATITSVVDRIFGWGRSDDFKPAPR
ncbi:MAG: hypothetical protein GIW94_02635 [Candidatus Eremiobacteraeota bacterium]|nr:hypothetical protein [Candidatus Eremiobacteraeota bacterium]